jgi:preprotein translocase subunit SecG
VIYLLYTIHVLVCLFLILVVLLQQGKGGGLAAGFGGGSSQTAFGARAGATVLTRATTVLATLFMLGAFALGVISRGDGGSVLSGVGGPTDSAPAVPALPMGDPPPAATPTTTPTPPPDAGSGGS